MIVTIKLLSLISGLAEEDFLVYSEMTDLFEDYRGFLKLSPTLRHDPPEQQSICCSTIRGTRPYGDDWSPLTIQHVSVCGEAQWEGETRYWHAYAEWAGPRGCLSATSPILAVWNLSAPSTSPQHSISQWSFRMTDIVPESSHTEAMKCLPSHAWNTKIPYSTNKSLQTARSLGWHKLQIVCVLSSLLT